MKKWRAAKLTTEPGAVNESDFNGLLAAGWSEEGIHDIVSVTCIYAFMNRLVEGSGIKTNPASGPVDVESLRAGRYSDMLRMIKGG